MRKIFMYGLRSPKRKKIPVNSLLHQEANKALLAIEKLRLGSPVDLVLQCGEMMQRECQFALFGWLGRALDGARLCWINSLPGHTEPSPVISGLCDNTPRALLIPVLP